MKHKSIFLLIALVAIMAMMASACAVAPAPAPPEEAAPAEEPAEEAAPAEGEELTIALSIPGLQFPFFVFMEQQVKDEAAKIGGIEIVTLDAQDRVDKQTADIEAAIAKGYDGILISPMTADAMAPAVQQAVDAGIPVVTIDRTVYDVDTLAHVGADNVLGGEQQGQALLELFPDGAVIFELTGTPGSSPAIDRSTGLHNVIDDRPEFEVACQQTADFNRDQGLTVTENCLGATPNPAAIIGANDEMAFGASEAAKGLGIADEVVIIGYDALPEALIAVRDGDLWGTVDQFPGEQSRVGLRTLVDFIREGTTPAEHDIFIQPKMITLENLDEAERAAEIGVEAAAAEPEAAMPEFVKKEPPKIGYSVYDMQQPYWQLYAQGIEDAATEAGYEFLLSDQKSSEQAQVSGSIDLVNQDISALVVSPVQPPALPAVIDTAHEAKIPVIIGDVGVEGDYDVFILSDNEGGGKLAAQYMVEQLKDKPGTKEVLVIELHPGSAVGEVRVKGFVDEIANYPDFEVVASLNGNDTVQGGYQVTQDTLSANPNLAGIYAANDPEAEGAVQALKAVDKNGVTDVLVVGFNGDPPALELIKAGDMAATIRQDPYGQGRKAVEAALALLDGQMPDYSEPEAKTIFFPVDVIDASNVDEFMSQ